MKIRMELSRLEATTANCIHFFVFNLLGIVFVSKDFPLIFFHSYFLHYVRVRGCLFNTQCLKGIFGIRDIIGSELSHRIGKHILYTVLE